MIQVAGSTFAFGNMSLEDSCAVLKDMGFKYADLGACGWSQFKEWVPQQVIQDIDNPESESDRIRRVTEANGLQISELFIVDFGYAINHPDSEKRKDTRQLFTKMAKIAQKAGFESMMMTPGDVHDADHPFAEDLGQTFDQAFQGSVEQLRSLVDIAGEHGMHCNIEPCIFSVAHHPDNAAKLVQAVPGLGLTMDYAHQVQLNLGHDDIEPMHAYAKHFQAKQSAPGEFQAKPDEGVIDFGRVIRKMKQDGFDGIISIEFVSAPEVLEKGWDLREESARLKEIVDEAIAAPA
jgi:sugar phosphate isomerase/epimerase